MADEQTEVTDAPETQGEPDPLDIEEQPEDSLTVADVIADKSAGKPDADSGGEFDSGLINRALEAGFTEEAARATGSPENLNNMLETFDRALAVRGQEALQERTSAKGDATSEEASRERFEVKLDPDEYGDGVVGEIKRLNEFYDSAIETLSDHLLTVLDYVKSDQDAKAQGDFDQFVEGLGKDYHDLLGQGPSGQLVKAGEPFANRQKVQELAKAMRVGYEQIGRTPPQDQELYQRALRGVFGDKIKSLARTEISKQLSTRATQHISRPATRKGKGLSGRQKAIRTVAGMMAEMGMGDEQQGDALLE